jgi:hypothetical protein
MVSVLEPLCKPRYSLPNDKELGLEETSCADEVAASMLASRRTKMERRKNRFVLESFVTKSSKTIRLTPVDGEYLPATDYSRAPA